MGLARIASALSEGTVIPFLVIEPLPFVITVSPDASPTSTESPALAPADRLVSQSEISGVYRNENPDTPDVGHSRGP